MFRQFAHVEAEEVEDDEDATTPEEVEEESEEESEEPEEESEDTKDDEKDTEKTSKLNMYSPETIAGEGPDVRPELNLELPELGKKNPVDINSAETIAGESNS